MWVLLLFALNAFIAAKARLSAAPVHYRMDREGKDEGGIRTLIG